MASKHTAIAVVPGRRKNRNRNRGQRRPGNNSRGGGGGRRRHRTNEQQRPLEASSGSAGSAAERERRTQSLRAPSSESEETSSVTLGPVSERIVMVRQGMNVVLECRDADADSRVYWTKHGGEEKIRNESRFFAVAKPSMQIHG